MASDWPFLGADAGDRAPHGVDEGQHRRAEAPHSQQALGLAITFRPGIPKLRAHLSLVSRPFLADEHAGRPPIRARPPMMAGSSA